MRKVTYVLLLILLTGCVSQKPLEELGLVTAIGYDKEDEFLKGTIVYYEFDPLHPNNSKIMTELAHTSKGIRQKENLSSSRKLVSGQLRAAIYGRELAEEGIISVIDTLSRDAEVGTMAYLSVSDLPANELLTKAQISEDVTNAGTYLYDLIGQNVRAESLISPTLHEFMQTYYSEGKDPVLPLLNFRQNTIVIDGIALFNDDQMVGTLTTDEAFYLKLLLDPYHSGNVEITIPKEPVKEFILSKNTKEEENLYLSLDHLRSDIEIKMSDGENPSFKIDVHVKTRMQEISVDYDLGNPEAINKIEQEISKVMKGNLETTISKLQDLEADSIGLGNYYRAEVGYKEFKQENWRELYKDAPIQVNNKVEILRTGVMD